MRTVRWRLQEVVAFQQASTFAAPLKTVKVAVQYEAGEQAINGHYVIEGEIDRVQAYRVQAPSLSDTRLIATEVSLEQTFSVTAPFHLPLPIEVVAPYSFVVQQVEQQLQEDGVKVSWEVLFTYQQKVSRSIVLDQPSA